MRRSLRERSFSSDLAMESLSLCHAAVMVDWRNDESNRSRFFNSDTLTLERQKAWIRERRDDQSDHSFIATHKACAIGMISIYNVDESERSAEIGRFLVDGSWRRRRGGFAFSIFNWALAFAFNQLQLNVIYANCYLDNKPIQNLVRSFSFKAIKTEVDAATGRIFNTLILTAADWRQIGLPFDERLSNNLDENI